MHFYRFRNVCFRLAVRGTEYNEAFMIGLETDRHTETEREAD